MEVNKLTQEYWQKRYDEHETGWDIGFPSPAITDYAEQVADKNIHVLIPGCGNAHEAEYLLSVGFTNITVIDIVPSLTENLRKKFGSQLGKKIRIVTGDFFEHTGSYELILEQTFLSALHPSLRQKYADKMHSLLVKGGHLVGVLFSKVFEEEGPPFGGTAEEYQKLFSSKFEIKTLEPCYNSIGRRNGNEVFINLVAK